MNVSTAMGRIQCGRCQGLNPEIAKFCNRCGGSLEEQQGLSTKVPQTGRSAPDPSRAAAPSGSKAAPPTPAAEGRKICPGCHRFNLASAAYCADCGVELPKYSAVPLFGGPAGFWIRLVAFVLDGALIGLLQWALFERLGLPEVDYERLPLAEALLRDLPALALGTAITCLYAMIMIGTWGGTAGKLILGLRIVRNSDGARVPYGLALGRSLAEFVSLIPAGLGYLWISLSPSKRGWHDYLCDTRVVYARTE